MEVLSILADPLWENDAGPASPALELHSWDIPGFSGDLPHEAFKEDFCQYAGDQCFCSKCGPGALP